MYLAYSRYSKNGRWSNRWKALITEPIHPRKFSSEVRIQRTLYLQLYIPYQSCFSSNFKWKYRISSLPAPAIIFFWCSKDFPALYYRFYSVTPKIFFLMCKWTLYRRLTTAYLSYSHNPPPCKPFDVDLKLFICLCCYWKHILN